MDSRAFVVTYQLKKKKRKKKKKKKKRIIGIKFLPIMCHFLEQVVVKLLVVSFFDKGNSIFERKF